MTQLEHLQRIRQRCVELLEIAEKRTAWEWVEKDDLAAVSGYHFVGTSAVPRGTIVTGIKEDACFIASCAGAAEAGWKATVAAIDSALLIIEFFEVPPENPLHQRELEVALDVAKSISAAWPEELL